MFEGIEEAQVPGYRIYLTSGDYDLEVRTVTVGESRKKVPFVGFEFLVTGSNNPSHPVGSIANYTELGDKDGWLGRIRGLLHAVVQNDGACTVNEITREVASALCEAAGEKIRGYKVRAIVTDATTRNGKNVTRHAWFPSGKPEAKASA
jgi:hypothetical protein